MNAAVLSNLITVSGELFSALTEYNIDATALNQAFAQAKASGVPFDPQPWLDSAQAAINAIGGTGAAGASVGS